MFKERLAAIRVRVQHACLCSGRSNEPVIVAVTKTVPPALIAEAIRDGATEIAESKVQEALGKFRGLDAELRQIKKHFIGHLQSNKARRAVELFDCIQSIDSVPLAAAVDRHADDLGKRIECLLEVKLTNEPAKTGFDPVHLRAALDGIAALSHIRVTGLMAMAPYNEDAARSRPYFRQARALFDEIASLRIFDDFSVLSMGMSVDFEYAIEEGATMIRVGSALFMS